jgi:hypothetical protein
MSTLIADTVLTEEGAPRVRFSARERRGVFLGLSFAQLMVISVVVGMLLVTLFVDVNAIWVMLPFSAVVFFFGVATYRREPVLQIIWQAARYTHRAVTKQTQFRRDVWWRVTNASLEVGRAHQDAIRPQVVTRFLLPGALGDVQVVQIPGAGAFVYNARGSLASITLQLGSSAWALRDRGVQRAAYDGFTEWLASLENMPGLVEATCRIRIDRASTNELAEYATTRIGQQHPAVSDRLASDYAELIAAAAKRSMGFTNYLTLTFSTTALNSVIRDGGGGMTGLAAVLKERVAGLEPAVERARLALQGWLPRRTRSRRRIAGSGNHSSTGPRSRTSRSWASMRAGTACAWTSPGIKRSGSPSGPAPTSVLGSWNLCFTQATRPDASPCRSARSRSIKR